MAEEEEFDPAVLENLPPAFREDALAMAEGRLDEDELVERQMERMGLGGVWEKYKNFDVNEAAEALRRGQAGNNR